MGKFQILFLIISTAFLAFIFWPTSEPEYPTSGSTIVVFGDSLAFGTGATTGGDIVNRLSDELNREVLNLGVPGNTTADGLSRIDELLSTDPRVVIVILGGNDTLRRVPVVETFANLAQITEQIQDRGAAVVLVGAPGGLYGKQYDKEYKRLAKEYRTFYVSNILSGLIGKPEYMSDRIHPNDAGYEIATSRILPEVERALRGR